MAHTDDCINDAQAVLGRGNPAEIRMLIPVPGVKELLLQQAQVYAGSALAEQRDCFTNPRLQRVYESWQQLLEEVAYGRPYSDIASAALLRLSY